ncbi:MAG: hypothetical protein QOH66_276 [Actinomycetota bacterium]|jgi:hypothetical protein|nr:hypothetical protein [Actinomycetota bacterium]
MVTGPRGKDIKPKDIVVFSITKDATCDECGEELWSGNLLRVVDRSRKRYERQGILVEEAALAQAEEECLSDADLGAARRAREAEGGRLTSPSGLRLRATRGFVRICRQATKSDETSGASALSRPLASPRPASRRRRPVP